MKAILFASLALVSGWSMAQESAHYRRAVRIPIRHADPYTIKAMLEGRQVMFPEMSTILLLGGAGAASQGASQAANAMFKDGFFFVNPTDNSLWFEFDK